MGRRRGDAGDNGDWDSDLIHHWCLPNCPLGCDGDEDRSCKECWSRCRCSECSWKSSPLAYRWKGMDEMLAWCDRECHRHRILPRALEIMYDDKTVERAQKELEEAAARVAAGGEEVYMGAQKQRVRGGQVKAALTQVRMLPKMDLALANHKPSEHFMNLAFKAGAAVDDFIALAEELPADAQAEPAGMKEARQKAIELNMRFISGNAGEAAIREMCAMVLNYNDAQRQDLDGVSDAEIYNSCLTLLWPPDSRLAAAPAASSLTAVSAAGAASESPVRSMR